MGYVFIRKILTNFFFLSFFVSVKLFMIDDGFGCARVIADLTIILIQDHKNENKFVRLR